MKQLYCTVSRCDQLKVVVLSAYASDYVYLFQCEPHSILLLGPTHHVDCKQLTKGQGGGTGEQERHSTDWGDMLFYIWSFQQHAPIMSKKSDNQNEASVVYFIEATLHIQRVDNETLITLQTPVLARGLSGGGWCLWPLCSDYEGQFGSADCCEESSAAERGRYDWWRVGRQREREAVRKQWSIIQTKIQPLYSLDGQ